MTTDECRVVDASEVTEVMSLVIYLGIWDGLMSCGRVYILQLQTHSTCWVF